MKGRLKTTALDCGFSDGLSVYPPLGRLTVNLSFMLQPAVGVPTLRVAVGPMDDSALPAPFVFAVKSNLVAFFQPFDFGSQVDIVRDQNSLPAI